MSTSNPFKRQDKAIKLIFRRCRTNVVSFVCVTCTFEHHSIWSINTFCHHPTTTNVLNRHTHTHTHDPSWPFSTFYYNKFIWIGTDCFSQHHFSFTQTKWNSHWLSISVWLICGFCCLNLNEKRLLNNSWKFLLEIIWFFFRWCLLLTSVCAFFYLVWFIIYGIQKRKYTSSLFYFYSSLYSLYTVFSVILFLICLVSFFFTGC